MRALARFLDIFRECVSEKLHRSGKGNLVPSCILPAIRLSPITLFSPLPPPATLIRVNR